MSSTVGAHCKVERRGRWWLVPGLFLLCVACAIGEPGGSSEVYVDAAADVFVYDASIGPEQPIAGALETVCGEATNGRGLATCMWYGGQMTEREMERRRQEQHTITVTVRAEGFHTFTRVMTYQNTPTFAIGLWPGEMPHLPEVTPPEGELVVNGDFSTGLEGWEVVRSATCTTCTMEVQSSGDGHPTALTWACLQHEGEREGRAVWTQQALR